MKSDAIVTALKTATGLGVDTDEALDQLGDLVTVAHAKPVKADATKADVILTVVPIGYQGKTCVVGWDTCGSCRSLLRLCTCKNGPTEPIYVQKFRQTDPDAPTERPNLAATHVVTVDPANPGSTPSALPVLSDKLVCNTCNKPTTLDEADRNDDQSLTCHFCQEASA